MYRNLHEVLNYDNIVLRHYVFWTAILIIKMLLMALSTGVFRFVAKAYANPEDVRMFGIDVKTDERVERIRRAHLNDLENILPFIVVSFVYVLSDPNQTVAIILFCIVVAFRFWHTFVYCICVIPQPARMLGFLIPCIITIYMAIQSAVVFVI